MTDPLRNRGAEPQCEENTLAKPPKKIREDKGAEIRQGGIQKRVQFAQEF